MEKVRVRFAPSPTGPLHLGGVRTALYNYLFSKHNGGDFILRIEDTDVQRYIPGSEEYIMETLEWIGMIPDESPKRGGPYAPYRQSERRNIYDGYIKKILKTDYAYLAFDTPEELNKIRTEYEAKKAVFSYNHDTRLKLRNSISLPKHEVKKLLDKKTPYVIRFKTPQNRVINFNDIIRGKFSVNTNTLDDKVLVKNDGIPTYHFANVIDDHEMKITHVIRGEEWLPSMALHILLYEAMEWRAPEFAHLPLILKPEGKGKLSKRDGDKFGFPVFPLNFKDATTGNTSFGFREKGYLPKAFINMLAMLGWSPAHNKEIMSLDEMIKEFDLYKVHKSGAKFNAEKAKWFNQQYLQMISDEKILFKLKSILSSNNIEISDEKLLKIIKIMKKRSTFIEDIYNQGKFFFHAPKKYDERAIKKIWSVEAKAILEKIKNTITTLDLEKDIIKEHLQILSKKKDIEMGKLMMPLRLSLVGSLTGPDIPELMEIIGKEESIYRISKAIETLT